MSYEKSTERESANHRAYSKYYFGIPTKKNFKMGCKNSKRSKKFQNSHDVPLEPEMPREPEMSQSMSLNQTDESDSFIEISDDEKNSESLVGKPKELRSSSESQNISSKTADHNFTKSDDDDVKLQNNLTVVNEASTDGEENNSNAETGPEYAVSEEAVSKIEPVRENNECKIDLDESSFDFDSEDMTMTELRDLKYTEETGDNCSESEMSTEDSTSDSTSSDTETSKSSASEASGVVITTL